MTIAEQRAALVEAALSFVGTRFRLHGRSAQTGLDCVGLIHASLAAIGRATSVPEGYRLRNTDPSRWYKSALDSGFLPVIAKPIRGDVILVQPGPAQQHLVIVESSHSGIHAHAGLGRVVRQPMDFPTNPPAHWRLH